MRGKCRSALRRPWFVMMDGQALEISLVCCVNRHDVFEGCLVESLSRAGMTERAEIIPIDNRSNQYSVPQALNVGIEKSRAPIVVCCHQDVRMPDGWLDRFLTQIALVEAKDRQWGVAGVMGIRVNGAFAGHIQDPHTSRSFGRLPQRVQSLDEVCLAIRRDSELRFDERLGGFHLYGADLCLQARMKGMHCYALDASVEHLSRGTLDESFYEMADRLCAKWRVIPGVPPVVETTCGVFQVAGGMGASILTSWARFRRKCWRRWQGRCR